MSKMVEKGQKWGHLTVVENNGSWVRCQCSCGNFATMRVSKFLSGNVKSCGHLGKEMFRDYPKGEEEDE